MNLQEFLRAVGKTGCEAEIIEYTTEPDALAAVQRTGEALQYVAESRRTEAVCLAAVQQNGYALQYVAESRRTEAVCLAAVQKTGDALQYVAKSVFTEITRRPSGRGRGISPEMETILKGHET